MEVLGRRERDERLDIGLLSRKAFVMIDPMSRK